MEPSLGVVPVQVAQEAATPNAIVALICIQQCRRPPGSQMEIECLTRVVGPLFPAVGEKEQLLPARERREIGLEIVNQIRATKNKDSRGI